MPYYAQLNSSSHVIGVIEAHSAIEAPNMIAIDSLDASLLGKHYDSSAGVFSAPPAEPAARHLSKLGFRNRFTRAEKVAIEMAALDSPAAPMAQRQQSAALRADLKDQQDATFIDLDRADLRDGVQALEAAGLLAAGRALQILDAPVQDLERYRGG